MSETAALKRPFLVGVLACAILFVLIGGVIALAATNTDDRPEGVAERWLTAVGDLTRDGVHADALERVTAHGDVAFAPQFIGGVHADGKSAFTALEVGKARRDGVGALVPAQYVARGSDDKHDVLMVLAPDKDSWRVVEVRPQDPTLKVPSDGGDPAAKAPLGLYAVGLLVGVGVAAGASYLVRLAGREQDALSLA